ncbi:MAG: bifunctional 3,4-dihydroxy-2-butanone-4-phosphate synthase/GTP cyclohydrolase II, partial [Candidatus Bipolaricaulia bacterium]
MEQQEERDVQLERVAAAKLPTKYGHFRIYAYYDTLRNEEYVALVKGDVIGKHDVLVYVHLQCGLGDVFDSLQCSSGDRLHQAMMIIEAQGEGVLIHLKRENSRNDGIVAQILDDLGV